MRIGFDVDGVLANFIPAYQARIVAVTGVDLFHPDDVIDPPVWDWPKLRGYTRTQLADVWASINSDPTFSLYLPALDGMHILRLCDHMVFNALNDIYFITNREGIRAKEQTEYWLRGYLTNLMGWSPTVIVVGKHQKGRIALALNLDIYIDDNYENCVDVVQKSPKTRTYLLTHRYNEKGIQSSEAPNIHYLNTTVEERRVPSVETMLHREGFIV